MKPATGNNRSVPKGTIVWHLPPEDSTVKGYWDSLWTKGKEGRNSRNTPCDDEILRAIRNAIKKYDKGALAVEAGCGNGKYLIKLHNEGYNIIGIDYSEPALKHIKTLDQSAKTMKADVRKLDGFNPGTVSVYVSLGVIEHFPSGPWAVMDEMMRVLKKGGRAVITVPIANPLRKFLHSRTKKAPNGQFFAYVFDHDFMKELFSTYGLSIEKEAAILGADGLMTIFPKGKCPRIIGYCFKAFDLLFGWIFNLRSNYSHMMLYVVKK